MTVFVPEAIRRAVGSTDYPALATGTGAVLVVLLIAVLVELQLAQAHGTTRYRPLRPLLVPLLLAFGFVVALRVAELLPYH
ncbi:MAG TPA: hypothetical protein VGJ77_03440 [Gaiellaceae bacterium]